MDLTILTLVANGSFVKTSEEWAPISRFTRRGCTWNLQDMRIWMKHAHVAPSPTLKLYYNKQNASDTAFYHANSRTLVVGDPCRRTNPHSGDWSPPEDWYIPNS